MHKKQYEIIIKSSRATSRVKWLKHEETTVSRSISVLVLRVLTSQLVAREDFIIHSRRESSRSYNMKSTSSRIKKLRLRIKVLREQKLYSLNK
jgi:hypothetical protein